MLKCPTMPLPFPMRHLSPIETTGLVMHSCPGTIPADRATPGPMRVSAPMEMYCSLKIVVGLHMMRLLGPNEWKRLDLGLSGEIEA